MSATCQHTKYVVAGISLSDIARGTGLSSGAVSRIFNGKRKPYLDTALSICDYISRTKQEPFTILDFQKAMVRSVTGQAA